MSFFVMAAARNGSDLFILHARSECTLMYKTQFTVKMQGNQEVCSLSGEQMAFTLKNAQFDKLTQRAYVELRERDADGGEVILVALFSYRSKAIYSKRELEQDLARKARHMLKRAAIDVDGRREAARI